jgi:hypothetical protein
MHPHPLFFAFLFLLPFSCADGNGVRQPSTSTKRTSQGGVLVATAASLTGTWKLTLAKGSGPGDFVLLDGKLECGSGGVHLLLPQVDGSTQTLRAVSGSALHFTNQRLAPRLNELRVWLEAEPTDSNGAKRPGTAEAISLNTRWLY